MDIKELDNEYVAHAYGRFDVCLTQGKGSTLYDDKGKKVTDEAEQPICVEIPTKVSDVNKAAEMLGKYYALFTDKLNVDGDMDYSIKIDYGGEDE